MFLSSRLQLILFLTFYAAHSVSSTLEKQDYIDQFDKMNKQVEPFRQNLTQCARQTRASMVDVENFLKRVPQSSMEGKCFVACMLKRNSILRNNKIMKNILLNMNKAVYGADSEVVKRLKSAIVQCGDLVEGIFEVCEFASAFNDCMHMMLEQLLDRATVERRMEALGQLSAKPDHWVEDEYDDDDALQLAKDEL